MSPALSMCSLAGRRKGGVKILIAAGGSGGHIFPAIALARTLKDMRPDIDIRFVGSDKILDRRIFEKEKAAFSMLSANKLPYRTSPAAIAFFIKLFFDFLKSLFMIFSYRPGVVVGFGGYVAAPVMLASCMLGIPRIAHEQNAVPGRANRLIFRMSDRIAVSFEETMKLLRPPDAKKAFFTGNPIRAKIFSAAGGKDNKADSVDRLGLERGKFTILIIGGSQGAHFLNETFIGALAKLDADVKGSLQVLHITGIKDYDWALEEYERMGLKYRVYSFIDRIEEAYSASDLVVTRSGASAIFELAFFAKPMILVPYPFAMSHQAENARIFSQKGAAIEIDEKDLSAGRFKKIILSLLNDRSKLSKMSESAGRLSVPRASEALAQQVLGLAKG